MENGKKRLFILSVPFRRIIRVLLTPTILGHMINRGDIIVVSPFSKNNAFRKEFSSESFNHLSINQKNLSNYFKVLFNFSEIMRRHGYWFKFRKKNMQFYAETRFSIPGKDGLDEEFPTFKKFIYFCLSVIGAWSKSWIVLDKIIGDRVFSDEGLEAIIADYEEVTLVQAASWGFQDRALAWLSKKYKWQTILIPFTTDQITLNGYLLCAYDKVCIQGTIEENFAVSNHQIPTDRLIRLGSSWGNYIEYIVNREKLSQDSEDTKRKILYSGISSEYFPRESELSGLELIINAIASNKIENAELVYRPVDDLESGILEKYQSYEFFKLQPSQQSFIGMADYSDEKTTEDEVVEFLKSMMDCDLLVMAGDSSICIECAFMNIPSISYYHDVTGILNKRETLKYFLKDGKLQFIPNIPVVIEKDLLVDQINLLLHDDEIRSRQVDKTLELWHFKDVDFQSKLFEVFN